MLSVPLSIDSHRDVILGLVPRIQPSTSTGASGWMHGRAKPDHDNSHAVLGCHTTSLLRQLDAGPVLAGRLLGDDLAADHALFLRIVGERWRAVELPAPVELGRDAMTEAVVVRPGQIAIELHAPDISLM